MDRISESYIIGVDKAGEDEFTLAVIKRNGDRLEVVNTFIGKEAEMIYNKISKPRGNIVLTAAGGEVYYEIVRERFKDTSTVYEDLIIETVGFSGLQSLLMNDYLACCRTTNGRRLYLLRDGREK